MADVKISALPASTTPLAGTEVLPIVQSSTTKQVSVANLTAGRAVSALSLTSTTTLGVTGVSTLTGGAVIQGLTVGLGANAVAGNTAVGDGALNSASLSGSNNIAIGSFSLFSNTIGGNNTAVGKQALSGNTTGYQNVAVGEGAIASNLVNGYNTALGNVALNLSTGSNNLGLGYGAGSALTTGNNNTIIGSVAGTAGLSDTVIIAAGAAERMRINSVGTVLVNQGASGGTYGGQVPIMELYQTSISSADADGGTQVLFGSSAFAIDTGAATTYGFKYNTAGNYATTARVRGAKENATDGNLSGYLAFDTRANGGVLTEKMRISSTGVVSIPGNLSIAAYTETIVSSGTVGASATLAITAGTVLTATLTSATACTFTMPTATAGKSFILLLKQPASGTATTATFTSVKWNSSGAPTITATVGKMDILTFVADGTNWYGSYSQGYTP